MRIFLSLMILAIVVSMLALTTGTQAQRPQQQIMLGQPAATATPTPDFVTDTFTEASDTELSLHTPEVGSTWVDHTDSAYPDTVTVLGATDRIALNASAGAGAYYNNAAPPSADYCTEAVIKVVTVVSANTAITLRMDTSANTMYIFQLNNGTGWRTRKVVAGTQTTLGTEDTTTQIPSVGDTKTMKFCVSGTSLTAFVNGTAITSASTTDGSISSTGKAGVRFSAGNTLTAGYHFESFRAFAP